MPKDSIRGFYVAVNFWRHDQDGNRVSFPRKKKERIEVVNLFVQSPGTSAQRATLFFADGTHAGPFRYSKWYPASRLAVIASNYEKYIWKMRHAEGNS